jgi:RecQ family ATP-dependent DNA helicase
LDKLKFRIESIIKTNLSDGVFIVLKGLPNKLLSELRQNYKFVDIIEFDHTMNLNLQLIKNSWLETLNQINNNIQGFLLFESFLFLTRNINIDILHKKFIIIENNVFDLYPNQSNEKPTDYESSITKNFTIDDNSNFSDFYSESYSISDNFYIRYIDGLFDEYKNITVIKLFDISLSKEIEQSREATVHIRRITFDINDGKYLEFIAEVLNNKFSDKLEILVPTSSLNQALKKEKLAILCDLLDLLEIDYTLLNEKNYYEVKYRKELDQILKEKWNSDSFRELIVYSDPDRNKETVRLSQGIIIEQIIKQYEVSMLEGNQDILITAPTGAGKSLLFQIPAIYLEEKYGAVTIVVSPLIALMKDQVKAMIDQRNYEKVAYLNSELNANEREEIISSVHKGEISILYLSPELLLSYHLSMFLGERELGLLVIDEAHLVTTWGRDFRVDYWYIGNYINKIRKYNSDKFVVVALTATAIYSGDQDMIFETINSLNMKNPIIFLGQVKRDNIEFEIQNIKLFGSHEEEKFNYTLNRISEFIRLNKKTLVYTPWTNHIDYLINRIPPEHRNIVGQYYGKMDPVLKEINQVNFSTGNTKVMLATKAFGMGIDISDIEIVYHHAPSGHLADYVQEIGRIARKKDIIGKAKIDFDDRDLKFSNMLYGLSSIKQYQVMLVLRKLLALYKINNSRNLLVTVNDFEHIFNFDNVDVEQKVKSSLLLLENDLLNKYSFNVIIARPKSLFTSVYIRVKNEHSTKFELKYGNFADFIKHDDIRGGFLYTLHLDKLWSNKFRENSFPVIKKLFFEEELFKDDNILVAPQFRYSITLNDKISTVLDKVREYFDVLHNVFASFQGFINENTLIKRINEHLNDELLSRKISNLFLSIYASKIDGQQGFRMQNNKFIQKRRNDHNWEYRIINRGYGQIKANVIRTFTKVFDEQFYGDPKEIFIVANKDGVNNNSSLFQLGYLLETFDLGTYELRGGDVPAIFVRINDPLKIESLVKRGYKNDVLQGIENRHKKSVEIMRYFFKNDLDNSQRWDLIENYFLGKDIELHDQ